MIAAIPSNLNDRSFLYLAVKLAMTICSVFVEGIRWLRLLILFTIFLHDSQGEEIHNKGDDY